MDRLGAQSESGPHSRPPCSFSFFSVFWTNTLVLNKGVVLLPCPQRPRQRLASRRRMARTDLEVTVVVRSVPTPRSSTAVHRLRARTISRALLVVDGAVPRRPRALRERGIKGTCPRGTCSDPATALVLDALASCFFPES